MPTNHALISGDTACHFVHFYGGEHELIEQVSGYLADGIQDGDMVVVVATAAHRLAFDTALLARGIDVPAARESGLYVVLDAATTMGRFVVNEWPDRAGFESTIGTLIRKAHATGRPVRAYGEMVALLWDAGHVNAAIELEGLWNALASQLPFSLFCAYPTAAVSGEHHLDSFTEVCRLHTAVVGEPAAAASADELRENDYTWVTIV